MITVDRANDKLVEPRNARGWNVLNGDPGRDVLWSRVNAGEAIPRGLHAAHGTVRPGVVSRKVRARYPVIILKMSLLLATLPSTIRRLHADVLAWWRTRIAELGSADFSAALAVFEKASREKQLEVMDLQMIVAQLSPVFWRPLDRIGRDASWIR